LNAWEDWAYLEKPITVLSHEKKFEAFNNWTLEFGSFLVTIVSACFLILFLLNVRDMQCFFIIILYLGLFFAIIFMLSFLPVSESIKLYKNGLIVSGQCLDFSLMKNIRISRIDSYGVHIDVVMSDGQNIRFAVNDKKDYKKISKLYKNALNRRSRKT
jgi:hypothetical protein